MPSLRLLWDNALRRRELVATNVGDLREGTLWIIGKEKTQQQSIDRRKINIYSYQKHDSELR